VFRLSSRQNVNQNAKTNYYLETPVFMFSLLRIFDWIFDIIIDDPYLT